jgi:hypothetical protein
LGAPSIFLGANIRIHYFRGCKQTQPSLLIQVSWSHHNGDELAEMAREVITLSNGKIRTVINVNLNDIYKESNEGKTLQENSGGPAAAMLSVWRARLKDVDGRQMRIRRGMHDSILLVALLCCSLKIL